MQGVDWSGIGAKIKAGMDAAGERADVPGWSLRFGSWVQNGLTTLSARINRVDWDNIGATIAEGLGKAFLAANVFIATAVPKIALGIWKLLASAARAWIMIGVGIGKTIVQAVIDGATALLPLAHGAGGALAKRILDGVKTGLAGIANAVQDKLDAARMAVVNAATAAYGNALNVGKQIVSGVLDGLGGLYSSVKSKIEGALGSLLSKIDIPGHSPPDHAAAQAIGKPLAQGVAQGFLDNIAAAGTRMEGATAKLLGNLQSIVDARRSAFSTAWSRLAGDALTAFDAIASQIQTKSEKALAAMQKARTEAGLKSDLSTAQQGLTDAQATGDPAAIGTAQKAVDDALYNQREYGLQQRATQERRELDASLGLQRRHVEDAIALMGDAILKKGKKATEATDAIVALLKRYNVTFADTGEAMGQAFVRGLKESITKSAGAAGALDDSIRSVGAAINVPAMAAGGIVKRPTLAMIGEAGPEAVVPLGRGSSGVGGGDIYLTVHGFVGNEIQLVEQIKTALIRDGKRNGSVLGGYA